MGQRLAQEEPAFAEMIERADRRMIALGTSPVSAMLWGPDAPRLLADTRSAQPALFAFAAAFTALLLRYGIRPRAVMGHSLGEVAAAHAAGIVDLEEGLTLVHHRAAAMANAPGEGAMLAVAAAPDDLKPHLANGVGIAAINAPRSVTLSGPADAIAAVREALAARGVRTGLLPVSHAFHSTMMQPAARAFAAAIGPMHFKPAQVPIISCSTGDESADLQDPNTWTGALTRPVQFMAATQHLASRGVTDIVEIGARPVLTEAIRTTLANEARPCAIHALPADGELDRRALLKLLARLCVRGVLPDAQALFAGDRARRVHIPPTPLERTRHWIEPVAPPSHGRAGANPRTELSDGTIAITRTLAPSGYLADHRVFGEVLVPGAGFLDLALGALAEAGRPAVLSNVRITAPLRLAAHPVEVQVELRPSSPDASAIRLVSRATGADGFTTHLTAEAKPIEAPTPLTEVAGGRVADPAEFYRNAAAVGIDYGAAFQGLNDLVIDEEASAAEGSVALVAALASDAGRATLHPALLDCAFHVAGALLMRFRPAEAFVPAAVETVSVLRPGIASVRVTAHLRSGSGAVAIADLDGFDPGDGASAFSIRGLQLAPIPRPAGARLPQRVEALLHRIEFEPYRPGHAPIAARSIVAIEAAFPTTPELRAYPHGVAAIEALARAHALRAIHALCGGMRGTAHRLSEQAGVLAPHWPLFARLLEVAVAAGAATRRGNEIAVAIEPIEAPGEVLHEDGEAADPPLYRLVQHVAPNLTDVLTGRTHPLEVLFPGGDDRLVRALYTASPAFRAMQEGVGSALAEIASSAPRPLSVLEVGGGTGSTTEQALAALGRNLEEYVFTDAARLLLERAAERFAHEPRLRIRKFDLEGDPRAQNFEPERFDLIIAANVVHATRDVERTLSTLRSLLRPGGRLALVEGVTPWLWADVTFGLTDGWWRFADAWRRGHPLLTEAAWQDVLVASGFAAPQVCAPSQASTNLVGQALILAQRPAADPGAVSIVGEGALATDLRRSFGSGTGNGGEGSGEPRRRIVIWDAIAPKASALAVLRALQQAAETGTATTIVTHGAWCDGGPCDEAGAQAAAAWGMMRSAWREAPSTMADVIDIAPVCVSADAARVLAAHEPIGGALLRLGGSRVEIARLRRTSLPSGPPRNVRPLDQSTVLVTGAYGGLGLDLLQRFANRAARVVGLGRSITQAARDLRAETAAERVLLFEGDVADPVALEAVRETLSEGPPLAAVIHAAGIVDDAPLAEQGKERLAATFRPKVDGALRLHEAFGATIDTLVLFSSSTGLLGVKGQANHAAACAVQDALAPLFSRQGCATFAIDWGPFSQVGAATNAGVAANAAAMGVGLIAPEDGFALVDALLAGHAAPPHLAAIEADWSRHRAAMGPDPLLEQITAAAPAPAPKTAPVATAAGPFAKVIAAPEGEARGHAAQIAVLEILRGILGLSSDSPLDPETGLFDLGIDSLTAMELRRTLEQALGTRLPATLAFAYPTPRALAGFVVDQLASDAPPPSARQDARIEPQAPLEDPNSILDAELERLGLVDG